MSGLKGKPLPELIAELSYLYTPCCAEHSHLNNLSDDNGKADDLAADLANMVAGLWKEKKLPTGTINQDVTQAFANRLWSGVTGGYGSKLGSIDFDTPDGKMLESLAKNTWQFAAAKNYTQLRQLTNALIGEDNKLRSFDEFKEAAAVINNDQVSYLKAEYNLAVAGGQMASKWVEFENSGAQLLQFDVIIDGQTSEICLPLDGITVKIGDPLLDLYYPPNHYGCRTTMRALRSGTTTPHTDIVHPEIPKIFQTNLAKNGLAFPLGHPYFEDAPKEVLKEALKLMPYDAQFINIGNGVRQHVLLNKNAADHASVSLIAKEKGAKGHKVDILEAIKDDTHRKIIFHDAKKYNSPDLRIDGILHEVKEVKSVGNINTIKHAIEKASTQANNVIIKLNEEVDDDLLKRIVKSRFIDHKDLQKIEFRIPDGTYKVYKK